MYNYVPSLSPKPGDVQSEEDISGFGSHSRFSYSLSSINGSHNNSHNSLQSLSSGCGAAVCISDKYNDNDGDTFVGIRGAIGLGHTFKDPAIEVFSELSVTMDVVPETDADIDVALGARYYF